MHIKFVIGGEKVKILLVMLLAFDLMYITYVLSEKWNKAPTAKEALETMREGLILKCKQLEQENRKGAKKNVSNSTRKRISAHSDKA